MIHPTAIVYPWVHLGQNVNIHPYAVVGRVPSKSKALAREPDINSLDVFIGDCVEIGPHAIVYGGVSIGADTLVGDAASIREGAEIGKRCVVGRHVTLHYDCSIADDVRLMDTTHITGACRIGAGSFFGVGVITSNDRNIDLHDYAYRGCAAPVFGERVMVGSGANVLAGVSIGDDALIAAGAVVVTDVPAGARMMGQKAVLR